MITSPLDYESILHDINTNNRQYITTTIPNGKNQESLFDINLNTRQIGSPKFLSVQYDHNAETIYFKCARYFDEVDLAREDITVIIQYENADPNEKKRGYIYVPKYKDIKTFADTQEIAFPWVIEGAATAFSGTVVFSVKFYKTSFRDNGVYYDFNLNTLVSKSAVLHGMDAIKATENYIFEANTVEEIYARISGLEQALNGAFDLYWTIL